MTAWQTIRRRMRLLLAISIVTLVPAAVAHSRLIPTTSWQRLAETIYRNLIVSAPWTPVPSQVAIVEVDQQSLRKLGWPISRTHWASMLDNMSLKGRPWILSFLSFQSVVNPNASDEDKQKSRVDDEKLAQAIARYGRVVGSGMSIDQNAEDTSPEEDDLLIKKNLLSSSSEEPDGIPSLPVTFTEARDFIRAQRAFGYFTKFGTESVITCMEMGVLAKGEQNFLMPSSLVWTAALANNKRIFADDSIRYPQPWQKGQISGSMPPMHIGPFQCLSQPRFTTRDFLEKRGISVHSLASLIDGSDRTDWTGKIIILASAETRLFNGPGGGMNSDGSVAPEHHLAARFLDDLLTGKAVRGSTSTESNALEENPAVLGLALFLLGLVAPLKVLAAISLMCSCVGLVWAWHHVTEMQLFLIPARLITTAAATSLLAVVAAALSAIVSSRRMVSITRRIREDLGRSESVNDIQSVIENFLGRILPGSEGRVTQWDKDFFRVTNEPDAAIRWFARGLGDEAPVNEISRREKIHKRLDFRELITGIKTTLVSAPVPGTNGASQIARIELQLRWPRRLKTETDRITEILIEETCASMARLEQVALRRLREYRIVVEQARSGILSKFLSKAVTQRFNNDLNMEENLRLMLKPRRAKAAIFQADIRGFSSFAVTRDPMELVQMLQPYYRSIVDAAQHVGQVKLVGDCVFFFIEDSKEKHDLSVADMAFELASVLIRETERLNRERVDGITAPVRFGIGIHMGDVIVGNLSSDECIDYTVIGQNVNLVARLEEFTKNPTIKTTLGANAVLMSEGAVQSLKRYKHVKFNDLNLRELNIEIRSFPQISKVFWLSATGTTQAAPEPSFLKT
jgi:class 3 adenylate cyclase